MELFELALLDGNKAHNELYFDEEKLTNELPFSLFIDLLLQDKNSLYLIHYTYQI